MQDEPEEQLPVTLPDNITPSHPQYADVVAFVKTFSDMDIKAYNVAKDCLGTSFDLVRSNGFEEFLKMHKKATSSSRSTT